MRRCLGPTHVSTAIRSLVARTACGVLPSALSRRGVGTTGMGHGSDEDLALPAELRAPKPLQTSDEVLRQQKTDAFIKACCSAAYLQDSLDMITAAVTHQTLRDAHVQAVLRRLKNDEADAMRESSERTNDARRPAAVAPQRRFLSILQCLMEQCYLQDEPSSSNSGGCVSGRVCTDGLLWFMGPIIRRVKDQARGDKSTEGDEDDVPSNPSTELVIPSAEIWQFVALMELHNIHITSEVVLDGLLMLLSLDDAVWRRRHSGQALADDLRKNRLEFVDAERNSLRERTEHSRILARRAAPRAKPEAKLSEVSPPLEG